MTGSGSVRLGRTLNCRDVGGFTTSDGRRVRTGLLYRSDLPLVDEADAAELEALSLRTAIDLREPEERRARPSSLEGQVRAVQRTFGLGDLVANDPSLVESLSRMYEAAIRDLGGPIAAVVEELCKPEALPALVHCAAGKDRTGIIIGLVLSAIGVADADVARDYAASEENLSSSFFRALAEDTDDGRVNLTALHGSDAADMLRVLALVREVSGGARAYLLAHGLSQDALDRLAETLLTPARSPTERGTL
jgi:protein-tyrosine phosphatase